jgi:hypothetical protein
MILSYLREFRDTYFILVLPDLLPPEEVEVLCGSSGLHHFPVYVVTISTAHRIKILYYVIEKYNCIFKNQ